jgi:VCBS repeat-containing protein
MPLDLSALTPKEAITAIYIGYYDRAPDAEGMEFWLGRYNEFLDGASDGDAGRSLSGIAERFSAAIETRDKYPYFEAPNVADAQDFLTSVYQNLFNRDPDQAGLDHWTTKLVTGQIPVGEIIIRIIQGAQDNGPGFNDRQTVLNKIEVACDWVVSAANEGITTSTNPMAEVVDGQLNIIDEEAYESASTILDGVTDEAQSVIDGLAAVDAFIDGYGNDAPDASPDAETVAEDGVLNDFVSATDPDGDALVYSIAPGDGPANGTLVMNADGTYTYTPNADYVGSDSFTYTVTDPSGAADKATVSLTVENTNDAPVASGVIQTTNEDSPVIITPSFTDLDNAQGSPDTATISVGSNPANGSVVVNANGTITYTPDADFFGTDSFQYIVTDAAGASSIATATVTVRAVNDAPVAADAAANATEGGAVIAGAVTASDVDGPSVSFSLNNPAPAGLSFNPNGTFTFNPADPAYDSLAAGQTQTINVPFTANDGSATDGGLLVITVTGTNDAPTASAVTATSAEDGGAITVTAITSDVDAGDTPTFSVSANPANGTVVNNNDGTFSYTPNANFNGVDSFTYTVTDSQGATASAVATITVSAVNDAPVSADVVVSSLEDQVVTGQLTATDIDGDQLTFAQAAGGNLQGGSLSLNADGSYVYTPKADFNGTASFNYTVSDGNGGSTTNSVTINIAPVADIFTPGVDNLNGGDGDDTFLGNEATLNAGDKAVGGAGNDTVIINVDTGADPNAQNLAFAGFELDVETFRTTVDGDGSATFDMSSSEITGNTFHVANSTANSFYNRVNMTPDGDGERGNGDDNNDGVADDELNIFLDNVTDNANITFTTRPGQVTGNGDEVNIVAHNRDANERIGAVSFYGTPLTTNPSGLEVADISTEGSPLDVFIEDLNIPGAHTLEVVTDTTSNAADLTIGDTSAAAGIAVSTTPGSAGISGFENPLDNSITTITGTGGNSATGNGGVALQTGNNGVVGSFGEGADTILGGNANDNLSGNGGNDILDGAEGNDVLNGGDGRDTLIGGNGNDTVRGGEGNDLILGESGNDDLFGDAGNDSINTGTDAGVEFADGGADNDTVTTIGQDMDGDGGNDPFGTTQTNEDFFSGGTGIDTLVVNTTGTTLETQGINNVTGFETVDYNGGTVNHVVTDGSLFETDHDARVAAGGADGSTTIDGRGTGSIAFDASTLDQKIELIGGNGNDVLIGGRGNDIIEGDGNSGADSGGNDALFGGAGDDTFRTSVREMDGNDTIEGDSGDDTIEVNTDNGRSGINAGAGGAELLLNGNTVGIETLKVVDNSDVTDEGDLEVTLSGFNNNDTTSTFHDGVPSGSDNPRIHIDGSDMDANESLIVNAGGNGFDEDIRATGGAGADTFNMGGLLDAGDQLDGGDGFDTVTVSDSQTNDFSNVSNIECIVVTGATNGDTIVFGADAEAAFAAGVIPRIKLQNAPGVDVTIDTTAFSGPVIIEDDANDNTFNTGPGDDTIIASTGTDTYNTDGGADVIRVSGNDLDITDSLNTGAGIDTVEMDNSTGAVNAVSNLDTNSTVENYRLTDDGDRVLNVTDADNNTLEFQNGNVNTLTEINVDFTALTDGDDTARVTLNANQQDADFAFNVEGSSTSDTFEKRNDGVDNNIDFDGNAGNDNFILNGGDAGSTTEYSGGDGFDSVTLSGGQITDDGFVNFDTIENLQSEVGQVVNARLGVEADQSGLQQITGSDGNDDVVADSQFNNDMTVITGPGDDRFDFGDTSGSITFVAQAGEVDAADDLQGGTGTGDEIRLTADNNTADLSNTEAVETVTVVENGDNNIGIIITNNTFTGVADNEIDVDASDLDDSDSVEGGLTLNAGTVTGGRVLDVVGGTGADNITTGTGNDTVSSGAGNDTVVTNGGNDTVLLGDGNDTASLGSGNDNATGDAGNDNIDAGIGADIVDGGTGNDTITGGQGIDVLTGGSGNDRFRYVDVEDSFSLSRDIITDFVEGQDCIVIETQLIANAIAAFNTANPGNPVPANIGLGVGTIESTVGFNNAGVFINGQGNVGPGYAVNFSDAQGAISQTARDGVADYILERNAGPNGENKLWVDVNDDGVLNGLDLQIFVNVDTLGTQNAVYMVDTIAPTISDASVDLQEVRHDDVDATANGVNEVRGDFDGDNAGVPDDVDVYQTLTGTDTSLEGMFDGVDNDGGPVTYTITAPAGIGGVVGNTITKSGTYGQLQLVTSGPNAGQYTYTAGATAAQRAAIEVLDDGDTPTDNFTIQVTDSGGLTASATFSVNVAGADDDPVLTPVVDGSVTEVHNSTAENTANLTGTLTATDVDAGDTLTFGVNGSSPTGNPNEVQVVGTYGTLTLNTVTGAYGYVYNDAAVEAVALGETPTDNFTMFVTDGDDADVTDTFTVTINGANDAPTAGAAGDTDTGAVQETNATNLIAAGSLTANDVDATDQLTATIALTNVAGAGGAIAGELGMLQITSANPFNPLDNSLQNVGWQWNSGAETYNALAVGETRTLTYTITYTDDNGGLSLTATDTVTITITGANDVPTIDVIGGAGDTNSATLNELPGSVDLPGASGTVTVTDVDITDELAVTVSAPRASLVDSGAQNGVTTAISAGLQADINNAVFAAVPNPAVVGALTSEQLTWSFTPAAGSQFDELQEGDTLTIEYDITVADGNGGTDLETISIIIVGTNDLPVIDSATNPAAIQEVVGDSSAQDIPQQTGTITVTDLDVGDALTFSVTGNGTVSYNGGGSPAEAGPFPGPNSATNADSVAASVAALSDAAAISFANDVSNGGATTSDWYYDPIATDLDWLREGDTLTVTFTAQVDDGLSGPSGAQNLVITITGTNDVPTIDTATNPVAIAEVAGDSAAQDIPQQTGTITVTDQDLGDTLTFSVTGNGVASLNGGGSPTEAGPFPGPNSATNADSVAASIAALTDAAAVSFQNDTSNGEDTTSEWYYDPAATDLDWLREGDTLTITFTAQVDDGQGNVGAQDLVITITGTNDDPVISAATNPNAIAEVAGDSSAQVIAPTPGGSFTVTDQDLNDTLAYSANTAVATWSGGAIGNPPLSASQLADIALLTAGGNLDFTGQPTTTNGEDLQVAYTYSTQGNDVDLDWLDAGETLTLAYTVTVTDGAGSFDTQAVTVTINGSNDDPIAVADTNSVSEDGPALNVAAGAGVLSNDSVVDVNDTISVTAINGVAASVGNPIAIGDGGILTLNADGSYTFDPNGQYEFLDDGESELETVTYTITTDDGSTATATLTITVTGVNDAPVAAADAGPVVGEDDVAPTASGYSVLDNDTDPDAEPLTVTEMNGAAGAIGVSTAIASGALVTMAADGTFTYDPNGQFEALAAGETATDTFTYTVSDGTATDTETVTVTINGANDPIVVVTPLFLNAAGNIEFTVADPDTSDVLSLVTDPKGGSVTVNNGTPTTYTPIDAGAFGSTFLTATDGPTTVDLGLLDEGSSGPDVFTVGNAATGPTISFGFGGDDVLTGNATGNVNIMVGGAGADTLDGAGGADVYVYLSNTDSGTTRATVDDLTAFVSGEDLIDLSRLNVLSSTIVDAGLENTRDLGEGFLASFDEQFAQQIGVANAIMAGGTDIVTFSIQEAVNTGTFLGFPTGSAPIGDVEDYVAFDTDNDNVLDMVINVTGVTLASTDFLI